jgi:hypothetical protein
MTSFTAAIATKWSPQAFIPNEGIYIAGALAKHMYIVNRGI